MTKNSKFYFFVSCVAFVMLAATNIVFAFLIQRIIDSTVEGSVPGLLFAIFIALGFMVLEFILFCTSRYLGLTYVLNKLQEAKNNRLWFLFRQKNDGGSDAKKYLSNFTADTQLLSTNYYNNKPMVVFYVSQFMFTLVAIFYINWVLSLAIIGASLLPFIIPALIQKYVKSATDDYSKKTAMYVDFLNECLTGKMDIVAYGKEAEIAARHAKANMEIERARRKVNFAHQMANILSNSLGTLTYLTALGVGAYFVMTGNMTFGYMMAVVQLMNNLLNPVGQLISAMTEMGAVKGVLAMFSKKPSKEVEGDTGLQGMNNKIDVRNLKYKYETDGENFVFNGFNHSFEKGKKYAVVGPSGTGKSTLAKILAGEITSYEGSVEVDGVDIKSIQSSDYKNVVRFLRQDPYVFNDTIQNNITFYSPCDTDEKMEHLMTCVALSKSDEFVKTPDDLVREISDASGLSGGQKQRIAIARTLYRGAEVLILDEATSGVGSELTYEILSSIFKSYSNLTCLVITHENDKDILGLFDEVVTL